MLPIPLTLWTKVFDATPQHVTSTLNEVGIHRSRNHAHVFSTLYDEEQEDWVKESLERLPSLARSPESDANIRAALQRLLNAASRTQKMGAISMGETLLIMHHEFTAPARSMTDTDVMKALTKWKHRTPRDHEGLPPVQQRSLEIELVDRWASRLLTYFVPHVKTIPSMAPLSQAKDPAKE